MELCSRR